MSQGYQVIVVGGGAAGFFGAISCARAHPQARVILLEAGRQPLAKVRISGGGRCNVTHDCFEAAQLVQYYPRGGKALRGAFTRFQPRDTVAWFASQGVRLKTEADGRMFPVTDDSQTIVDCLMDAAREAGVKLVMNAPVKSVRRLNNFSLSSEDNPPLNPTFKDNPPLTLTYQDNPPLTPTYQDNPPLTPPLKGGGNEKKERFEVELKTGEILTSNCVLLATGSNPLGYRWAQDLGHKIESPVPSLFTFNIKDVRLEDLAGVSVENAQIRLLTETKPQLEQMGALLVTHWGLSGPVVLKLSAWGARCLHEHHYQLPLSINWLPQYNSENLRAFLLDVKAQNPRKQVSSYSPLPLPKRLWQRLVMVCEINNETIWAELSKKALNQLVQELTKGRYQIQGKGVFKEEFVTCGGVNLKEIDFKTMESKICSGLYFAGEILDIDGVTGGFNFQSAWTTSWLAGQAMGSQKSVGAE